MDVTDLSRTCQIGNGLSRRSGSPGNVANLHRSSVDGSDLVINVAYRSDDVVGCSDVVEGRTTNVTEPEWSGEVMAYDVVYRGMTLSDRIIAVDIHVHDTTKQDHPFITSCMDVVRTWLIAR